MNDNEKHKPDVPTHGLRRLRICVAAAVLVITAQVFMAPGIYGSEPLLPRLQLIPALLAFNFVVVGVLLLLTLLCGRVYCAVICPLGILQDVISCLRGRKPKVRRRFGYRPARNVLRYSIMVVFLGLLAAGMAGLAGALPAAGVLEPYSAFGRMASHLLAPLFTLMHNLEGWLAEQLGIYLHADAELWQRSWLTFAIAVGTFALLAVLAWRYGRLYCNTLCPVGALLSLVSRWSLFGIRINTQRCVSCGLCAKQCKASCIHPGEHTVDASRCVSCMNCLDACHKEAISYGLRWGYKGSPEPPPCGSGTLSAQAFEKLAQKPAPKGEKTPANPGRRHFLLGSGIVLGTAATRTQEKLADGGLAAILDKEVPERRHHIVPPGARSHRHLASHCTGCQLCVAACPNGVLRPSADLTRLMQPECSYERGYCRPECNRCSEVCPAGAIEHVPAWEGERSSIQVGHAVWLRANCVVLTDGVSCGNCARHCPVGAITMVPLDPADPTSRRIPAINEERCIGCGACEHLCPARPHSAIYVEGHEEHRTL